MDFNMFVEHHTQLLFPVVTQIFNIQRPFSFEEKEVFNSNRNHVIKNEGNTMSENSRILDLPELQKLKKEITTALFSYFNNIYKPSNGIEIYLTQSWLNYTQQNQYHHSHFHPNSFISGVLYIQTDVNDCIVFQKGHLESLTFESKKYDNLNSDSATVQVTDGNLILFPSSLKHRVPKKLTKTERISLSFNTFLKGNLGKKESLTELIL